MQDKDKKSRWDYIGKELEAKEEFKEKVGKITQTKSLNREEPTTHLPPDFDLWKEAETNPDFALGLTSEVMRRDPETQSNMYLRVARFFAFREKGIPQTMRQAKESDLAKEEDVRQYVTDEHLNWLELALQEFADIQKLGSEEELKKQLPPDVDLVALIVERCRPGRVHAILGWTKLSYLGLNRVQPMDYVKENLPVGKVKTFLQVPFSFPRDFRSAVAYDFGKDATGRESISFKLLDSPPARWDADDTIGEHTVGDVIIYSDGSAQVADESPLKEQPEVRPANSVIPVREAYGIKAMGASFIRWFQMDYLRMYFGLTFIWCTGIFLTLFIFSLTGSRQGSIGAIGSGIVVSIFFGAVGALYVLAISTGPIKRLDEKWAKAIAENRLPWWVGLIRLGIVVLPYYCYGWVPRKAYDLYFYKFLISEN